MWRPWRADSATTGIKPEESLQELRGEIGRLSAANRADPDRETERRLLRVRHIAGMRLLDDAGERPSFAAPNAGRLPEVEGLPELPARDLTPGLLRAGILRYGSVLVRGLVDGDNALALAAEIDRAFAEREGGSPAAGYYEEFDPDSRFGSVTGREWIEEGGGVLAADAPMLFFQIIELFGAAGLPALVEGYLGECPLISVHKTTLRKAEPSVPGAWHQDGAFMGQVRSLNLWLSLSRCGDESPGLDIVPRRLESFVTSHTDEAVLDFQVSQAKAEEAAGDRRIIRPIFEPGDAVFFDEMCLHQTASDPSMPRPRFAIENWFFGASAFPAEYAPIAV